jgi:hypothetical protein
MGLDLKLEGNEPVPPSGWTAPRPALPKSLSTGDELLQAHEMQLQRMDELRAVVERLEGRIQAIASLLEPAETALRQQGEAQERVLREAFAGLERHWGQTAARYRSLADDLARRHAGGRSLVSPLIRLRATFGGFLMGLAAAVLFSLWTSAWPGRIQKALGLTQTVAPAKSVAATPKPTKAKSR